jgi:SPP1 gp7 family putative phage head morphogenesis protein
MSILSDLRDRFFVKPVADELLKSLKVEKADTPNIMQVPFGFNDARVIQNRRMAGGVDFATLRALSVNHETTRGAINVRKRQITQLGFDVVDVEDDVDPESTEKIRAEVKRKVSNLGGPGVRFRELLDKLIEDTLVLDALTFYKQYTKGHKLLRIIPTDGSTIKLRVGPGGERPLPPEIAFEQWIKGEKVADLTTEEFVYEEMNPRTNSPYGLSPLETLILVVDSSLRAGLYNLNYLSDNNVPQGFLTVPEGWSPTQIKEYKDWFDAMLTGSKNTSKVFPIPGGAKYQPTSKPSDFSFESFFQYLDLKVCMLFDVTPQELGISLRQYKENAEVQNDIQLRRGIKPLANFLGEIFTDLIQLDLGYPDFEFRFTGIETRFTHEDIKDLLPIGVLGIDEVRNDLGLPKIGIDNIVVGMGGFTPLITTVSGTDVGEDNPETSETDNNAETLNPTVGQKIAKVGKNTNFEKLTNTKNYRQFKKNILKALEDQYSPFMKEVTIDDITQSVKADTPGILTAVKKKLPSITITGLPKYLKWAATEGGQNAFDNLNIKGTFDMTSEDFQAMLGDRTNYLIDSLDSTSTDDLVNLIAQGKSEGMTNAEIADEIQSMFDDMSSARADTIANTEVANAMQTAELSTYADQGITEKIWVTSEDDLVCSDCADLDGETIGIEESFSDGEDSPPDHPNCRCFIQAVIPGEE